jgi:hypothetical protein
LTIPRVGCTFWQKCSSGQQYSLPTYDEWDGVQPFLCNLRLALTITGLDISHLTQGYVNVIVVGNPGVALAKGVTGGQEEHPSSYALYPNHPNPFNPSTTLTFDLPRAGEVKLSVVDILGREVIVVSDGQHAPGRYSVIWNGRDFRGGQLASGVYIARLTAIDALGNVQFQKSVKMLLAK